MKGYQIPCCHCQKASFSRHWRIFIRAALMFHVSEWVTLVKIGLTILLTTQKEGRVTYSYFIFIRHWRMWNNDEEQNCVSRLRSYIKKMRSIVGERYEFPSSLIISPHKKRETHLLLPLFSLISWSKKMKAPRRCLDLPSSHLFLLVLFLSSEVHFRYTR